MANLARHLKIDPEQALHDSSNKFINRFNYIELKLKSLGKTPIQSNLEEMDALWDEAKQKEK